MLVDLSIRDLALIESLELELGPGLNAISGETGAGKSLFVGALELLRGETPRGGVAQWVRSGAAEARVEGRFEIESRSALDAVLEVLRAEVPAVAEAWEESLGGDAGGELIIGRSLSSAGRTRSHIHQRPVPLRALRTLAPILLEIHGQNDHQLLFAPSEQLRLLDVYGDLGSFVERYGEARDNHRALSERFRTLDAERNDRRDRGDLLRYQIGELDGAGLETGERSRLRGEREVLRNASDLCAELGGVATELAESDHALVDRLREAVRAVERWTETLPALAAALEDLQSAEIHVGEASHALSSILDGVHDDPARLEAVEERLAELERLELKYRTDEDGLIALGGELADELARLEADEKSLASLEAEIVVALDGLGTAAEALTKKRMALVPKLTKEIERTFGSLGLEQARFDVRFSPRAPDDDGEVGDRFGPRGDQDVEFFFAANPGESVAPLRNVASGGEAARIMLALRTALRPKKKESASARTMVFDEIDAGVGGRLGPEVGQHLHELGEREQVLCVTHIPAIAAAADLHLCVTKEVKNGRTRTTIVPLSGDERVAEVADMIAGGSAHDTARAEARRLLESVNA